MTFGVESGSDRILELINKDITVKDVYKAHERLKNLSFKVSYHFMIGFPEETKTDIRKTLKLIYDLTKDERFMVYGPSIYVPYPGTTLFDRVTKMGYQSPDSLEGWITYDWDSPSKLQWSSSFFKRYIYTVQFVASEATAFRTGFIENTVKNYFRLRLLAFTKGIDLPGIEVALAKSIKSSLLSLIVLFRKNKV
ncbi:MAG: radical SAM protein [Candidatus Anammoxibacter sp.]